MNAQLVLEGIGVRFPGRLLFENVNWTLYEGMRVSLAGRNGCGKSTLLRILAGQSEASEGRRNVVGGRRLRIGYLDQAYLESAVLKTQQMQDQTQSPIEYLKSHLDIDLEETNEIELEWQIKKTLGGLGFDEEKFSASINHLSGGWLLRMFIGAALLNRPDVLLLDEPTNHLDISSIQWLEEFLSDEFDGSLVLVTHDVALQKRTTDSLAILHGGHFHFRSHQKDYFSFQDSLTEEKRVLDKNIEGTRKKIKELEKFISGFGAKARMASRAQSKQKSVDKLLEELEELENRRSRVEGFNYNLHFNFQMDNLGSKFPIVANDLKFRYSEQGPWIIKGVNLDFKRGQKVAIIGDNGAGKTTLLNVLAERYSPTEGELALGHGVTTGYFGQHQLEELSLEDTVLENLRMRAKGIGVEQLRAWLGAFGFCGNYEISKPAKVLSGGEKARLALLRLLSTPVNAVLLDEPTNHLDVETKQLLKNAFKSYEGTLIFISHDREFVEDVAERIIYLSITHELTDHIGNLKSFFEKYPEKVRHLQSSGKENKSKKEPSQAKTTLSYEERKKRRNQLRSTEKKIATIEGKIDSLGKEKETLQKEAETDAFYLPENDARRKEVFARIAEIDKEIGSGMSEWEKLSLELETLKSDQ